MIDKCDKCGVKIHWDNSAQPPAASNRAKEGKAGWFVEEGGVLHTLDRCKKTNTPAIDYTFQIPNVAPNHTMDEAANTVLMAMSKAKHMVETYYPNLDNENLKGQIRSRIVDQLLSVYNTKVVQTQHNQ